MQACRSGCVHQRTVITEPVQACMLPVHTCKFLMLAPTCCGLECTRRVDQSSIAFTALVKGTCHCLHPHTRVCCTSQASLFCCTMFFRSILCSCHLFPCLLASAEGQTEATAAYEEAMHDIFALDLECHQHQQPYITHKGHLRWEMIEMWPMTVSPACFCQQI